MSAIKFVFLISILIITESQVCAGDENSNSTSNWYIGLGSLHSRLAPELGETDYLITDKSGFGYKFLLGKTFERFPNWQIESFISRLGKAQLTSPRLGVEYINYDYLYGIDVSRNFLINSSRLKFKPKVGVAALKISSSGISYTQDEKAQWFFGGGLEYELNPHWDITIDYSKYADDVIASSVVFKYKL